MAAPVASAGMLIRRPVAEVFEAFVDPALTSRFWFTGGSGRLAPRARVRWDWAMYGVGTDVVVKAIEPNRRILIDWDVDSEPNEVEWRFEARGGETWVTVENRGFGGSSEAQAAKALDSTGGFTLVLAGAKIWLEHGIEPRFVVDRRRACRGMDGMSEPVEIRVEKRFRHPRERVFDAFLDPSRVGEWLFHTPEGVMELTDYDPRPGGAFAIFERRGADLARHFGRFVEIERPDRVVFDFRVDEAPDEPTRVTVTFLAEGEGCVVVLTHDLAPAWASYAERTTAGWTMILDSLAGVLEHD